MGEYVNMDEREVALARLLAAKYVWRELNESTGEVKYYIKKKDMTPEAYTQIAGLYREGRGGKIYIDNPVEIMHMLKDVPPFSETYEGYLRKPQSIRAVRFMDSAERVVFGTYYLPVLNGTLKIGESRYNVVEKEDTGKYLVVALAKGEERYRLILEKKIERPPLVGLMWKEEDVKNATHSELFRVVSFYNTVEEKKFPVISVPVADFILDGKRYALHRVYDYNPLMNRERREMVVEWWSKSKIYVRHIDDFSSEEDLMNLKRFIRTYGFESLNRESFARFLRGEVVEQTGSESREEESVRDVEIGGM